MKRQILIGFICGALIALLPLYGQGTIDPGAVRVANLLHEIINSPAGSAVDGRTYELSEPDLNAYIAWQLRERPRPGIEEVQLRLSEGSLMTMLDVDMDKVELPDSTSLGLLRSMLSGRQKIELAGTLSGESGVGQFELTESSINSVSLPVFMLTTALQTIGQQRNPPLDLTEPFELPFGLKSLALLPRKLLLTK